MVIDTSRAGRCDMAFPAACLLVSPLFYGVPVLEQGLGVESVLDGQEST
jgi:hypothetical protein